MTATLRSPSPRCTAYSAISSSPGSTSRAKRALDGNSTATTRSQSTCRYPLKNPRVSTPARSARSRGQVSDSRASASSRPVPAMPTWSAVVKPTPSPEVLRRSSAATANSTSTATAASTAYQTALTGRAVTTSGTTGSLRATPGSLICCSPVLTAGTPHSRQASQPTRMDVGDQDGAGPDLPQLVHDPVGVAARHHRAHRRPARGAQRRDGRRLEAGGDRHRPLHQLVGDVVVHQDVLAGDQHALQPPDQLVHPRRRPPARPPSSWGMP